MASVVSMFAWRRIFCATDGCTFARARSVAVVCRSEWKTMPFFGSGRVQSARLSVGQRRLALSSALSTWPQQGLRQRCSYVWKWTLPTGEARTTLLWRAIALVSVWIVTAAALRHYASFAYER